MINLPQLRPSAALNIVRCATNKQTGKYGRRSFPFETFNHKTNPSLSRYYHQGIVSWRNVAKWKRDGGTLRFGIPRRLDGKVRMELQFGRNFPALKDTLWSLEQVR
ncbi:MAG: hypothetical protein Q9M20_03285 [Mariprofundaceae bacterium]|nr:hypothetical protein [Mariprofundaceae bacterium]